MKSEFFLDMVFVKEDIIKVQFIEEVEKQLHALFSNKGHWHIEAKQEGSIVIIVAEINGICSWNNEAMVFEDLERDASPQFWEWLQGYQIRFDVKEYAACSHCGKG